MGILSLNNAIIAISSLIMLSTVSGLLFAVLVQPRRNPTNLLFSIFCFSLLLWSLVALAGPFEGLRFGVSEITRTHLLSTAIGLSSLSFFIFTHLFVNAHGKLARWLLLAGPGVLGAALLLIWRGDAYQLHLSAPDVTRLELFPAGYVALGVQFVYALGAFWLIISSPQEPVRQMRLPGLLMVLVYLSLLIADLQRTPVSILMATLAAAWMGWVVLRTQLFQPMQEITDELRIANRDLRQTLTDLSAERAKTESLTRQLEAAGEYRSSFLDHLGHRLRTPLNSITGYSQLLESGLYGDLNERQMERLRTMQRNTDTLLRVIHNMLNLNAIAAGRLELQFATIELAPLIDKVFGEVRQRYPEKQPALVRELPADLHPIYGDAPSIEQILTQLVDNAVKFSLGDAGDAGDAPADVRVVAKNVSVEGGKSADFPLPLLGWLADGDWVIVSVIDRGIGIAPEEQSQIFDEFFQTGDKRAADLAGTGLGLVITKRLVEQHGGSVWLKSMPDQGSTFFVALRSVRGEKG